MINEIPRHISAVRIREGPNEFPEYLSLRVVKLAIASIDEKRAMIPFAPEISYASVKPPIVHPKFSAV